MSSAVAYDNLDFEPLRALAGNPLPSRHEKVGFRDRHRQGKEEAIFRDLVGKPGS